MKTLIIALTVLSLGSCGVTKSARTSTKEDSLKTVRFIAPVKVVGDSTIYMR